MMTRASARNKRKRSTDQIEGDRLEFYWAPRPINFNPTPDAERDNEKRPSGQPYKERLNEYLNRGPHTFILEMRLCRQAIAGSTVVTLFRRVGQEGLLQLHSGDRPTCFYEKACLEFIGGIHTLRDNALISTMRGQEVEISPEYLRARFRLDTLDAPYICKFDSLDRKLYNTLFIQMVTGISFLDTKQAEDLFSGERKGECPKRWLKPIPRIISNICGHVMIPRKTETSMLRDDEIFLIHAIYTGSPLYSMAWVMLCCWMDALDRREKKAIPFPITLSTILRDKGFIYDYKQIPDVTRLGTMRDIGDRPTFPDPNLIQMNKTNLLEGMSFSTNSNGIVKFTMPDTGKEIFQKEFHFRLPNIGLIQDESTYLDELVWEFPPLRPIPIALAQAGDPTPPPTPPPSPPPPVHHEEECTTAQMGQRLDELRIHFDTQQTKMREYYDTQNATLRTYYDTKIAELRNHLDKKLDALKWTMDEMMKMMQQQRPAFQVNQPIQPAAPYYGTPPWGQPYQPWAQPYQPWGHEMGYSPWPHYNGPSSSSKLPQPIPPTGSEGRKPEGQK